MQQVLRCTAAYFLLAAVERNKIGLSQNGKFAASLLDKTKADLCGVAHDLRTYLTRLRMRSELIENDTQRDKSIRDIEEMTQLIEDTLSLGEAVAKPSPTERIDLADWMRIIWHGGS